MTTIALAQARDIIRRLTMQEKLHLLNELTAQLVQQAVVPPDSENKPFPVLHLHHWPDDIPQRREELYNDHGR